VLSQNEVSRVIDRALSGKRSEYGEETIDDDGRAALMHLSEGYPHFIQQFGYCAFASGAEFLTLCQAEPRL
jgi:hypothetical protein